MKLNWLHDIGLVVSMIICCKFYMAWRSPMINIQFGTSRNRQSLVRMVLFNGSNIPIFVTYNYPNHPKSIPKASPNHPKIIPKSSQFYNITSLYYVYTMFVACSGLQLPRLPQNDPNFTISPVYTILGSLYNTYIYNMDLPRNMGISYWFIWISNQLMIEW